MYSCTISGMSREMMKMDGRDSAEYQIWEWKDIMVILSLILSHKMTKFQIVTFFIKSQERKTWEAKIGDAVAMELSFQERESLTSL